jgi:hypothetical protein
MVRNYLNTTNIQVPIGAVVKVNGEAASMDRLLWDVDSMEILAGGESSGSSNEACGILNAFDGIGNKYLFNDHVKGCKPLYKPWYQDQ